MEKYMLPCLTKKFLGFDCMGCGLQRAALFLIKGEFANAFHMYPGIFPLSALLGFVGISFFIKIRKANIITIFLGVTTAMVIIVSYLIKLIHLNII